MARFRYLGLYLILSTPIMPDTVPLYLFSVFNEKGHMELKWFALASFLGRMTRGPMVMMAFVLLGWRLT